MRTVMLAAMLLAPAAYAQTPTNVGPSVATPTTPQGKTPPGAPTTASRNDAGQAVIGKTGTPPSAVPGNTGGADSGSTKVTR